MRIKKRFLGFLLSLALVLGLMSGMRLTAYADDNPPYASLKNTTTVIHFDSKEWYMIDYDSSTVTLLAKECVGASKYDATSKCSYIYSGSTIENVVNEYYRDNITTGAKTAVSGSRMFLLTKDQQQTIFGANPDVLKCSQADGAYENRWWLCTRGLHDGYAAVVTGTNGYIESYGREVDVFKGGVRPALQLDLSKVTFDSSTNTFTFTEKKAATVTKAPTEKTLTANGSAQELVTAGVADGGTMNYALGENSDTAPTDGWSTSIPTGTDAGTYYVWYKVVGDDSHTDSVPVCIKVVIEDIEAVVEQKENTPKAAVEGLDEELASDLMNDEEKKKVQSGEKATLTLEMTNIDGSVSQEDKSLTEKTLGSSSKNGKVGMYLDLSLWLKIGADYARQLSETGGKQITVKMEVPENLRAPAGVTRKFFVFHIHNGTINKLAETTDIKIPVTVGEFSTFVLAYEDDSAIDEALGFYSGLKITQKNGKIKVSWDKGEGAAKYGVFVSYCGKDYSQKPVKTTKSTSVTIKKINSKKIDITKNFTIYVAAYDSSGKQIGNTVSAHVAGKNNKKYKNAKTLKLSTKTLTLSIGKTAKIKASVKMEEGKKKELSDGHAAKFRYRSTNKNVATVDKNGNVTGVAAGTCEVYVYSRNGLAKKCTVTVK